MWIFLSSVTAGLFAGMATFFLLRAHTKRVSHPIVSITVHPQMLDRLLSDPFLDEDDATRCECPRCTLCPPDEDNQFDYSFAQINRLRFTRWLVEKGHLSEF